MSSADPVKLYEYFALGKPVVSTPIRQLATFKDGRVLRMSETPKGFVEAIASYLSYDDPRWRQERRRVAQANSWSSKAATILEHAERLRK